MSSTSSWLGTVIRVAIAPVLVGALVLVLQSASSPSGLAAAVGLLLLGTTHVVFWWRPWSWRTQSAMAAIVAMIIINFVLLNLLGISQPLLWVYPALIAGAGLAPPLAVAGVALTALAAAAPIALDGTLIHPSGPVAPADALGPSHSLLLSIVLAGLSMTAVRQLMAVNADLQAARAELAGLAVATERERLAREVHDLLGRTLSLIAVKVELASRLSAEGDRSAAGEPVDVQRLARQAVRDVRDAVTGSRAPSLRGELAAAEAALRSTGIQVIVDNAAEDMDPAHETTMAWVLREAVTNVVKHSGASKCQIAIHASGGSSTLEVQDDGRGPAGSASGTGLDRLNDRVSASGGTLQVGPADGRGFRVRVQLGAAVTAALGKPVAP